MKDIKILGVDIAKDVFQLCGIDEWGAAGSHETLSCSVCIHRSQS